MATQSVPDYFIPSVKNPWIRYEQFKREWIAAHPDANPEQYERAIAAICKRLGV